MPSPLHNLIARRIETDGPMDLGEYMSLCLGHPQYGYYMTRDPFGANGDFITAPEISQMFGEMLAAWVVDAWDKLGRPSPFALVECGPGRGTLMEDILRVTRNVPNFHMAKRLRLMEMSPVLREAQSQRLDQYAPVWINDLGEIPTGMPVILIGNEFLDALPIRQLRYQNGWQELVIANKDNATFSPEWKQAPQSLLDHLPPNVLGEEIKGIVECSPAINQFLKDLGILLQKQKGAALFIDYGHTVSATGVTLQAVREHRFENPFANPGECDLTAHVDFENIARQTTGIYATKPVTQSHFLKSLGIEARAATLKSKATDAQKADIDSALARLIDDAQMGTLFKVIALCHNESIQPAGFPPSVILRESGESMDPPVKP